MKRKEKSLKKLLQNPVVHTQRMIQYNFRTRLKPSLFSGHFDKVGTVLASRHAHSSCKRMAWGAKTSYTFQPVWPVWLVQTPGWQITHALDTRFWHNFFRGFSLLSIFCMPGKNSVIRVSCDLMACYIVECYVSKDTIGLLWLYFRF